MSEKSARKYGLTTNGVEFSIGDLADLLTTRPGKTERAQICWMQTKDKMIVTHEWDGTEWVKLTPDEVTEGWSAPLFNGDGEGIGRKLVLGELKLVDKENEVLLVTARVVRFTCESKAGDYQAVRGYAEFEPQDLHIHVPIYDPGQLVKDSGDVDIFAAVFKYIARALDMEVYAVASERQDVAAAAAVASARTVPKRFEAGKEAAGKKKETTVEL